MDPNFAGTHDYFMNFGVDNDGNVVVSDPNQYANYWDPFYQSHSMPDPDRNPNPNPNPLSFAPDTATGLKNSEGWGRFGSSMTSVPAEEVVPASSTMASVADPAQLEDTDFSETVKYISQILMEENFETKPCMYYDPLSLQLTEKSFYDALKLKDNLFPLSPDQHPLDIHQSLGLEIPSPDGNCTPGSNFDSRNNIANHANSHVFKSLSPDTPVSGSVSGDHAAFQFNSNSHSVSHAPSRSQPPPNSALTGVSDGVLDLDLDSSITKLLAQNIFSDADSISQFRKGLEEASKFLPRGPQLVTTGLEENSTVSVSVSLEPQPHKGDDAEQKPFSVQRVWENSNGLKSRKNHEREEGSDAEEEGRSNKQSAVSSVDESEISEMFDQVLLSVENVPLSCAEENKCLQLQEGSGSVSVKATTQPGEQLHSSDGGKARSKKQGGTRKKETVDLSTLLVLCAQAVSTSDNRTANGLLKQIRQHSSPLGDASQRLAHYFANGLETRLVGANTGTQIFYTSLSYKRMTAAEYLKAYRVFLSASPFKKFAHFFANKMIKTAAEKAETLHIIDFGIMYGFQWPILIKFLSKRSGGPPKLRITGIEFPQPGFRPTERIEETGRRLANYCKRFNVPFDYKAIASRNWETIQIEDLKIESNELLAVNCLTRLKNLLDETIEVNSPRNGFLNLIRRLNPDVFVNTIVNGSYNAPFFVTRFREALFHYSAIFDMCDTVIPRENEWRLMIEREFFGREIMNVVACEGLERVERPETYKQWQVRITRAGFRQLPLNKELMATFRDKLREWYHRDFVFDEDNNWMLQGWKGRILFASTCWVPA